MRDLLIAFGPPIGYIIVALFSTRHAYIQIVDNDRELEPDVRLNAVLFGVLWPLSLIGIGLWHLGSGWLFRETPKQRKLRQRLDRTNGGAG